MRKLLLAAFGLFVITGAVAQTPLLNRVKELAALRSPGLYTADKVIAIYFTRPSDAGSRDAGRQFEKAAQTFSYAKLKDGRRGLIVVAVVRDSDARDAAIAVNADGLEHVIPVGESELRGLETGFRNVVYGTSGEMLYNNLETPEIYGSIQKLITR